MNRKQRAQHDMLGRVRNFGNTNTDVFPAESAAGKTFGKLAAVVTSIEAQLVRRADARADARKVKVATRRAVAEQMKAIAATGRVAVINETGTHPFRMPARRLPIDVLSTARLFREEAERRKERFLELGMAPTFLEEFDATIAALADAIAVQQDSRGARGKAQASIEDALARGMKLVTELDVTVANALARDPGRLGQFHGARHVDYPPKAATRKTVAPAPTAAAEPAPATTQTADGTTPPEGVLKVAS